MRRDLLAAAVAACFASGASANPTGANVISGAACITSPMAGLLQVKNTPGAIINWQSFSISPGETTRFVQQSAASAVLNRVVTSDPSSILGTLQSNGRVFLINPNGIVFGQGAVVDVAGMVASSLNISNQNFSEGKLIFDPTPGAGAVVNNGSISTASQGAGGHVYLVGPAVTNGGLISTPQGAAVLAAGESVELVNPWTPDLSVKVTASGNEALNLGQIFADSGKAGIYAGLIQQQGMVSANTVVAGEDGSIRLVATGTTTLAAGSSTTSSGPLTIESGGLEVRGFAQSGVQRIDLTGALSVIGDPGSTASLAATGGQTIRARSVEVVSTGGQASILSNGGEQAVSTTGMNAAGEGLAVRSTGGGFASVSASSGNQSIDVRNADRAVIDGVQGLASVVNVNGVQTFSVTGAGANALALGAPGSLNQSVIGGGAQQTVVAGNPGEQGSITIVGTAAGGPANTFIVANPVPGGAQTVRTSGALTIAGGSAASGTPAGIFANAPGGQQTIEAGSITLQGGMVGAGNSAVIGANNGAQDIRTGRFDVIGGDTGVQNFAQVRATNGLQRIASGDMTLIAGAGGTDNFSTLSGLHQDIDVTGNLTITAQGSASSPAIGGGARIGSVTAAPTDLRMRVSGDLIMSGGSLASAVIGTAIPSSQGQPTQITMDIGGSLVMNAGTTPASRTRIGSHPDFVAGGDISINAGNRIEMNSAGPGLATTISTLGSVALSAGQIVQGADSAVRASSLRTSTTAGANLGGANAVDAFSATNFGTGAIVLSNASPVLNLTGIFQNLPEPLRITQSGDLLVSNFVQSGAQTIEASGALTLRAAGGPVPAFPVATLSANGGQTIRARSLEVAAEDNGTAYIRNSGGDQLVRIAGGGASAGIDVSASGNGTAFITNDSPGATQSILVTDADHIRVNGLGINGASINASGGTQSVSISGSGANEIRLGSAGAQGASQLVAFDQSIAAGAPGEAGAIVIVSPDAGSRSAGIVTQPGIGNAQSVSTSGTLSIVGGNAAAQSPITPAGIFHNGTGTQSVLADAIRLQGGANGSGNAAIIGANNGSQAISAGAGGITLLGGASAGAGNNVILNHVSTSPDFTQTVQSAGALSMTGGSAGTNNFALIQSRGGRQTIAAGDTTMRGGAGGVANFASIVSPNQQITIHGDLAIAGDGSANGATSGGGAGLGGLGGAAPSATNLTLVVDGKLTMTGGNVAGTGASIGGSFLSDQPTDLKISVGGDVTLKPGTAPETFARIGARSASPAGGNIEVTAGGVIDMQGTAPDSYGVIRTAGDVTLRANQIVQGASARILASSLDVAAKQGANLAGANAVNSLRVVNATSGAVTFNNASPLLTVAGIDQVRNGTLSLQQAGNLLVSGNVSSGAQSIAATGDLTIAPGAGSGIEVHAHGAQSFTAGGKFSLLGGSAWDGYALATADGTQRVRTGGDLAVAGGSGLLSAAILYGKDDLRLTVGDALRITGGSGLLAAARVQADFGDKIYVDFLNRERGGYFVDGREGVVSRGLDGFFVGLLPAVRGRSLVLTYAD